mmetsp:Transcript_23113/g.49219  ORF Transcript_23113/g.49219 Transcript_23113/m.49219 type:complete len:200 (-) Transcript_23113:183-782(-)
MGTFLPPVLRDSGLLRVCPVFDIAAAPDVSDVGGDCNRHTRDRRLHHAGRIRILLVQPLCALGSAPRICCERQRDLLPIGKFPVFNAGVQLLLVVVFVHRVLYLLLRTRDHHVDFHRIEPEFHAPSSARSFSSLRTELPTGGNGVSGILLHDFSAYFSAGRKILCGWQQREQKQKQRQTDNQVAVTRTASQCSQSGRLL